MTAKNIYDMAIQLLGLKNSDGTDSTDCADLKHRAVDLLNILIHENLPLDRVLCEEPDKAAFVVSDLDDNISSHETLSYTLYPYGLAAFLARTEDTSVFAELYGKYAQNRTRIMEEQPSVRHGIEDCYVFHG